jgi:serine/threonine protein kinase
MHYYDMAETWEFNGGPKLLYTQVIFQDGDKYFSAQLPEQIACPDDIPPIAESCLKEIPIEHIWPPLEDGLSICHDAEKPGVYIKQPQLTGYDGSDSLSLYLLQEARICQILIQNEHQNIARYLGCVVKGGRVIGLCFQRYVETLADRLKGGRSVNIKSCLQQVQAGIDHLHALNLIHNDIHLGNIMVANQEADTFVIIDFDSCAIKGHPLPDKRGRMPEGACTAEFENDELGFEALQEKLQEISAT